MLVGLPNPVLSISPTWPVKSECRKACTNLRISATFLLTRGITRLEDDVDDGDDDEVDDVYEAQPGDVGPVRGHVAHPARPVHDQGRPGWRTALPAQPHVVQQQT